MSDISSPLFQWLNQNPHLAGLFTFIISAVESVAIIGTIIPGSVMMTAIGTLAGAGIIPLPSTLFWAIMGAIAGDGISYWIGRYFNQRLPSIWPFRNHPSLLSSGEKFITQHGTKSVFIGRFIGPVRAIVPLIAGMLRMSPIRFTLANVLSAIGWAPAYMLPGILLGAASLELPPDLAVHALISLLLTGLLIILCIWSVIQLLRLISQQIEQRLIKIWIRMGRSKKLQPLTKLLRHHDPRKRYGQLILGFYFLIVTVLLLALMWILHKNLPGTLPINQIFFHTFRSLRTPWWDNIFLAITFLGDKQTLLPLIATLTAWLVWKKRYHTALHIFLLGFFTSASIFIVKNLTHSLRPWGIAHNPEEFSFPSGHVTLSVAFYFAIIFLLIHSSQIKQRKSLYWGTGILVFCISLSRLYLGAHWFTDIIGAALLGTIILSLIILSWNRREEKPLSTPGILITLLVTFSISYTTNIYFHWHQTQQDSQLIDWPTTQTTLQDWWEQKGPGLPLYRINRFGLARQILNLQWLGELSAIKNTLIKNGWKTPPHATWIDALHRIANVESNQHLPLVEPLYFGNAPQLVLIKPLNENNQLIILRLWQAHIRFIDHPGHLWVGTIEKVPSTYSWLFPNDKNNLILTSAILFDHSSDFLIKKQIMVSHAHKHLHPAKILLLLKPRV